MKFNLKGINKLVKNINNMNISGASADRILKFAAEDLINKAQLKAPVNFGDLQRSQFLKKSINAKGDRNGYRIGFNKNYAKQMDTGFDTKIIKPKKAKALYIPITRRGARTGPTSGGIRRLSQSRGQGGPQVNRDFVFRKSMKAPRVKTYGSQRGPNRFFSGTIERVQRNPKDYLDTLGETFIEVMKQNSP